MKKVMNVSILILTINLFGQSPWTKEKGKAYTQLSFSSIANYNALYGDPDRLLNGEITDNTLQFYTEYGITDKTTLLVNVPYKLLSYKNDPSLILCKDSDCFSATTKNSFGNIEIGVKQQLYKKNWIVSGQLSLEMNTSTSDNATGISTGYNAWAITPLISIGRGFNDWYVQGFTGFNIKTNNYSSNFKFGGEAGYKALQKLWLILNLDILTSFNNGNIVLPASNVSTGLYVNNQEYVSFGLKAIVEITDTLGLTAGMGGAFYGNNVPKKGALNFGVYQKF